MQRSRAGLIFLALLILAILPRPPRVSGMQEPPPADLPAEQGAADATDEQSQDEIDEAVEGNDEAGGAEEDQEQEPVREQNQAEDADSDQDGTAATQPEPAAQSAAAAPADPPPAPGATPMTLYVSSVSFEMHQLDLEALFGQFGKVLSAKLVVDRETGKPRGFAFVEMASEAEAKWAMTHRQNKVVGGRALSVTVVKVKPPSR